MKNVYSFWHSATLDKATRLSQNMRHQSPSDMVPYPKTMEGLVSTSLNEKKVQRKFTSDFVDSSSVQSRIYQIY